MLNHLNQLNQLNQLKVFGFEMDIFGIQHRLLKSTVSPVSPSFLGVQDFHHDLRIWQPGWLDWSTDSFCFTSQAGRSSQAALMNIW